MTPNTSLIGGFEDRPRDAASAFRAIMTALAHPGQPQTVHWTSPPKGLSRAAGALVLTLCDAETPLYLAPSHDTEALRQWITFLTSAPFVERDRAMFALGVWDDLGPLTDYPIGTSEFPERGTTFIVDGSSRTQAVQAHGPGIKTSVSFHVPNLYALQLNAALFPQGHDFFFCRADQLIGLPRSTQLQALQEAL